ncbi:MAG: spore coat polysaccharide biosynthesis protein SpsF [Candidatus Marinamargulisbacteria bacterium]|jgi:spore coat polysaccharide biosynthesis protein SpsF
MDAIFITARLKSSRLKRKVLIEVNEKPVIGYLIDRLKANTDVPIVLCTSDNPEDEPLVSLADSYGISHFSGSEDDVIERYYEACQAFNVDRFYIVYGDEPFTDIEVMRDTFSVMDRSALIWVKNDNLIDGTFGYGMTGPAIALANKEKISENNEVWGAMIPGMDIEIVEPRSGIENFDEDVRLTIDYPEDLEVFQKLIDYVGEAYKTVDIQTLKTIYRELDLGKINFDRIAEYNARIAKQGEYA